MTDLTVTTADGVARITLSRPPVNAITIDTYREITQVFAAAEADPQLRCVIFAGAGERAFCAGFDFRRFDSHAGQEDDPARPAIMRGAFEAIRTCSLPVIAAVNGPAIGAGCVLAAVCDIRIVADHARFGLPEVDFGRIGGAAYLAPLLPRGVLRQMAFTGRPISAEAARFAGLADAVVPLAALADTVDALAAVIAAKKPVALRAMKQSLNRIAGLPEAEGYRAEQDASTLLRVMLEGVRS